MGAGVPWPPPRVGCHLLLALKFPHGSLLCFIPESPVLGVFALKVFCGAGANKACLVQGIPLLSVGKLLGEIHHMGEIQQCVCIFA